MAGGVDELAVRVRLIDAKLAQEEAKKTGKAISGIGKSSETAGKQAQASSKHFGLFSSALGGLKTAAGVVGIGGLVFGMKDAIDRAVNLQEQQSQLRQSLAALGPAGAGAYNQISAAVRGLASHGGFTEGEQLQGITQFIRLTGSATQALHLNTEATNLARGAHLSFSTAQRIMGQALTGNVGRLQRYLGIIQPVKTHVDALTQAHKVDIYNLELQAKAMGAAGPAWLKQQELYHGLNPLVVQHAQLLDKQATAQLVLQRVQGKYGAATTAFSKTTAGAMNNARNAFELFASRVGKIILPIVTKIFQWLAKIADWVGSHMPQIVSAVSSVVGPFVAFGKAVFGSKAAITALLAVAAPFIAMWAAYKVVNLFKAAVVGVKEALVALKIAQIAGTEEAIAFDTALDANPIGLIALAIGGLIAALSLLGVHFKDIGHIAGVLWNGLKSAVSDVVGFFVSHGKQILEALVFPFVTVGRFVIGSFNAIKHIIGGFIDWVGGAFKAVGEAIVGAFKTALNFVITLVDIAIQGINHLIDLIPNPGDWFGMSIPHIPQIPHLSTGGMIPGHGTGDVVPIMATPGEFMLRKAAAAKIGAPALAQLNATGGLPIPQITITPMPLTLKLQNRTLTRGVVQFTLETAARGPSSLVGGAMTTGASTA